MESTIHRFEALSRLCLNNWHYIDKKILSFQEGINFFTGHSGSGKSTVIDAIQVLLYADTDGRSFFNKAAADDSDRTLIEYLRGMVNIGEDNEYAYLRNRNFSSAIVMELKRTDNGECQCIGVAFDVETASNSVGGRLFFWHDGPIPAHGYRSEGRAMATEEIRAFLQGSYEAGRYYFGPSNERFRKQLYDVYLGGLNEERFPKLFRRAIPFRMKVRLEDFVKEYICVEEDIQIEEMQESVMQYGRLRRRIGETCREIEALSGIRKAYGEVIKKEEERRKNAYCKAAAGLCGRRAAVSERALRMEHSKEDLKRQEEQLQKLEGELSGLEEKIRDCVKKVASSGYEEVRESLKSLNELLERLNASKAKWNETAKRLAVWEGLAVTPRKVAGDIKRFAACELREEELTGLKEALEKLREETAHQKAELDGEWKQLERQERMLEEELKKLEKGEKAYPPELEKAKNYIADGLKERTGREVPVVILADLIEVPDDTWRNAVEGYMSSNKLHLVVEPAFAAAAMELYEELDAREYYTVSVLDTEKVTERRHTVLQGALSEEVECSLPYIRAYLDHLLGGVIKCASMEELRRQSTGITSSCELYQGYRFSHINPKHYRRYAYIGNEGKRRRIQQLRQELLEVDEKKKPLSGRIDELGVLLKNEILNRDIEEYLEWQQDIYKLPAKKQEQRKLQERLEQFKSQNVEQWVREQKELELSVLGKKKLRDEVYKKMNERKQNLLREEREQSERKEELAREEAVFLKEDCYEEEFSALIADKSGSKTAAAIEVLKDRFEQAELAAGTEEEEKRNRLTELRTQYLRLYPNRAFSAVCPDNKEYEELLDRLQYSDLDGFYKKAETQALEAVELFKQDFIFKIRSAIQEAMVRKEELNHIIDSLDFGKDKYRFKFSKNKGPDGKYYDMFMAEDLEINPASLQDHMDNQMNMFTMGHEDKFGDQINELIGIFIPPENATAEEQEEARKNMLRYADYRTYLSFEMEQIIETEHMAAMKIPLSRMIKKNSGGEGQNPLYVALLASFAQVYRIDLSAKLQRNPTLRLVILDEAFSKMDAEKVASCIKLIRGFGFQAIISATNDKIQNYLESVDKTFVFANPNKKHISVQEFERTEFGELRAELEQEEETD